MKKIVSLLLCAAMVLSLTACGGGKTASNGAGTDGEKITLTMWTHQEPAWNEAYDRAIQGFMAENENIEIKQEIFPYDEFESKVQTSLIDGEGGADIYELWGGWALDFTPHNTLMEIPAEMAAQIQEEAYAPTYGALMNEGKLYGVPFEFNIENGGLLVNLNLMEAKGLTVPTTWDELKATAKAGTEMDGDLFKVKGCDFVNTDDVLFTFLSLILQQGANYLTEDGKIDVTTPEAKKAFEEMASFVVDDKVTDLMGITGGGSLKEGFEQLYANQVLMVPRGPWVISEGTDVFELELGKDFDYVEMPWYGSEHKFAAENGWAMAINAKSAQQEAAMKFVEYMWQDEVMLPHNIACQQIPAKKSLVEGGDYLKAVPHMSVLTQILGNAQFIGPFNTERAKESIDDVFIAYCSGNYASVDEAMEELNTKLNAILK